jgi:hypothetical protein
MADEKRRIAHTLERGLYRSHVILIGIKPVLRGHHFLPLGLERWEHLVEA